MYKIAKKRKLALQAFARMDKFITSLPAQKEMMGVDFRQNNHK